MRKQEIKVLSSYGKAEGALIDGESFSQEEFELLEAVHAQHPMPLWVIGKIVRDVQAHKASELPSLKQQIDKVKQMFGEETIEGVKAMITARILDGKPSDAHSI